METKENVSLNVTEQNDEEKKRLQADERKKKQEEIRRKMLEERKKAKETRTSSSGSKIGVDEQDTVRKSKENPQCDITNIAEIQSPQKQDLADHIQHIEPPKQVPSKTTDMKQDDKKRQQQEALAKKKRRR